MGVCILPDINALMHVVPAIYNVLWTVMTVYMSDTCQIIQECTLSNALSLWEVLSVDQAKQLTLINQVIAIE